MKRDAPMTESLFGWCNEGRHDECLRKLRPFLMENKKLVWRNTIAYCSCKNKKCPCSKQEKTPWNKAITDVELPDE